MTLTELKYIVAVAREKHFGRAAESCFVSQPTLSVAIKKLEESLCVQIFERGTTEITVTPIGDQIVTQAQRVLEEASFIKELAKQNKDPLSGILRIGVIYTIGPYLLPKFVKQMIETVPKISLVLKENYTVKLIEMLKQGEIDVAIMALPFSDNQLKVRPLYEEPFFLALPHGHKLEKRQTVSIDEIKEETMLLLGSGHCFRDHVLDACPHAMSFSQSNDGIEKIFEGSSLETIRYMVASGAGITVLPRTALPEKLQEKNNYSALLSYVPFAKPVPCRQVVLVWRKSFTRVEAIDVVSKIIKECQPSGVKILN